MASRVSFATAMVADGSGCGPNGRQLEALVSLQQVLDKAFRECGLQFTKDVVCVETEKFVHGQMISKASMGCLEKRRNRKDWSLPHVNASASHEGQEAIRATSNETFGDTANAPDEDLPSIPSIANELHVRPGAASATPAINITSGGRVNGERHACTYLGCPTTFTRFSDLRRHVISVDSDPRRENPPHLSQSAAGTATPL